MHKCKHRYVNWYFYHHDVNVTSQHGVRRPDTLQMNVHVVRSRAARRCVSRRRFQIVERVSVNNVGSVSLNASAVSRLRALLRMLKREQWWTSRTAMEEVTFNCGFLRNFSLRTVHVGTVSFTAELTLAVSARLVDYTAFSAGYRFIYRL